MRVTDVPASGHGRACLVERELEQNGYAALKALVADYLALAERLDDVPMGRSASLPALETRRPEGQHDDPERSRAGRTVV